jgi:protein-S-isoprenylcysteine O-methyltransferase Ste14
MSVAALLLFGIYLGTAFAWRTWTHWRRTGDSGFRGISGRPGSPEWTAGVLFVVALVAGVAGPVVALAGLEPIEPLAGAALGWVGLVLASLGIIATLRTQIDMGASWRIGVKEGERTDLVTTGAFALARNPIFTAMALTGLGLALMTPNAIALTGSVLLIVALELQVRVVEEPYLLSTHGQPYREYATQVGRFVPGIGRLPTRASRHDLRR